MVFVHHIIALPHISKALNFLAFILIFLLSAAGLLAGENITLTDPAKFFRRQINAPIQDTLLETNFTAVFLHARKSDTLSEFPKVFQTFFGCAYNGNLVAFFYIGLQFGFQDIHFAVENQCLPALQIIQLIKAVNSGYRFRERRKHSNLLFAVSLQEVIFI